MDGSNGKFQICNAKYSTFEGIEYKSLKKSKIDIYIYIYL